MTHPAYATEGWCERCGQVRSLDEIKEYGSCLDCFDAHEIAVANDTADAIQFAVDEAAWSWQAPFGEG